MRLRPRKSASQPKSNWPKKVPTGVAIFNPRSWLSLKLNIVEFVKSVPNVEFTQTVLLNVVSVAESESVYEKRP